MRTLRTIATLIVVAGLIGGGFALAKTKIGKAEDYHPDIDPANFEDGNGNPLAIDNEYFPLVPGTTFYYETETDDGLETDEVYVSHDTVTILGVTCVDVVDTVRLEGELIEFTHDWYAQDADGNVWYFGEATTEYENGSPVSTEGSWTAGVDDAEPGIIMLASPASGDSYRQEYSEGVAEDMASVMRLNAKVEVPYGEFDGCLETKEWSPLEHGATEQKFYAKGYGNVLVVEHHGKAAYQQLVDVTTE